MQERTPIPERGEPCIDRDYYDNAYIVIDDTGEPVGDFHMSLADAREYREGCGEEAKHHRVVMVGLKILADEPEIVDDPRRSVTDALWDALSDIVEDGILCSGALGKADLHQAAVDALALAADEREAIPADVWEDANRWRKAVQEGLV